MRAQRFKRDKQVVIRVMDHGIYSVNQLYARALLQRADRYHFTLPVTLRNAVSGDARVPMALQDQLWDAYCHASNDPLAGLHLGLELQVGHLDSAGVLLATCDTLGEALDQLVEIAPIVGEGGDFLLEREGDLAAIHYRPHLVLRQSERVEAVLAGLLNLSHWASGGQFRPTAVHLSHKPLTALSEYRALIDCPLYFGSENNSLSFSVDQLERPLIQANSTLHDHLRYLAERTLVELGQHSLSARVQRLIRAHPRWGKKRIADSLGVSERHLGRLLADESSSFSLLRDMARYRVAVDRLDGDDSLQNIAEALGFSGERAFAKAFRRWVGVSPAQFREQARRERRS